MESGKLSIGDFGDKVTRLHETLTHQGFTVSSEEVKRKFFGPSTRETVGEFQKTHGIEPSCEVCQQTANLLASNLTVKSSVQPNPILTSISNNDLRAKEVADRACLSSPIAAPLRFGDRSAEVANLQTALLLLLSRNFLGVNAEEQKLYLEGLLREQKEQFYNDYTAKVVSIFQNQLNLNTTGEVDRATADELERVWRELCPSSNSEDNFIVTGTIRQETGNFPLEGIRVVVVDKYVGGESILGEAITNSQGNYEIQYLLLSIRERGKQNPDLQIKVTKPNVPDKILALSGVLYNAGSQEVINVTVPDAKLELPEEYQRLTNELSLHLGNQDIRFAQLQENGDRQDITYLANKTGWDARMVAMVALADQFSQQNDIPSELYYALFRSGLPANQDILSQINPEMVQQLWSKAIEDKIIPEVLKESIPQSLERFKSSSTIRLLEQPAQVGVSSFKQLLNVSLGDDSSRQQRFAQLYYQNRDHLDDLWSSVRQEFGDTVANRLQLDGKLSFLTINNGNLIKKLHQNNVLESPLDLVRNGFYKHDKLKELLTEDITIPAEILGKDVAEKKVNYVDLMINQLKLSYPTAIVAEMINNNDIPLRVNSDIKGSVYQFLNQQQGKFELGVHPIENYLQKNNLTLVEPVLAQIKQLQRVYQISPSDEVMGKLVEKKIDSAYAIIQYDEREFINTFKDELGGEAIASLTYAKAHQVHHAVLNIATSYLITHTAPKIYALSGFTKQAEADEATEVIDPTLENLFGEMDYCACEHCRSVLSPAAYFVNLLQFIDLKKQNSEGVELPPTDEKENPIEVLLRRRPDIQHIQLTCENTNTVLPYIDLVNEILEYFVVNNFSLTDFKGYNIEEGVTTEELLANPQFVNKEAYNRLKEAIFPLTLPFHQPLEALRQYFNSFDIPLHIAMEQLRKNDNLDVQNGVNLTDYDWQDILIERLQMSRQEYKDFTDSNITLQQAYGLADTITETQLINLISNAKVFARRVEISYEEVVEITKTKFINPNSDLIPKLEKLRVDFKTIKDFHDGTLVPEDFDKLRTKDSDLILTQYGGDVKKWVRDNYDKIGGLILLSDPTGSEDICSFDKLEFRYALPDFNKNQLKAIEFWKLLRFIRLWKKIGWSVEYIDKAMSALYPSSQLPEAGDNEATIKSKLDVGFKELILRLVHLKTVIEKLNLNPKRELTKLLTLWSDIDTNRSKALYHQMFLNSTILHLDDIFEEDGYGNYPRNSEEKITQHRQSLQAAFNLTTEEFELIFNKLNFNDQTKLTLENLSIIFRYSFLAKKLKLSIREFLILQTISGIDPFVPLLFINPNDSTKYQQPAILRFIELAQLIKRSPFKISQLVYLLQHEDISGKASPTKESILYLAKTISDDLIRIDRENTVQDDPTGEVTKVKMTLVYGNQTTDTFFGLLNDSALYSIPYSHPQQELEANIRTVTDQLTYDRFQKQLSFRGVMTETIRITLKNVAGVADEFKQAIDSLFDKGQVFFAKFPDLRKPYDNYVASSESIDKKMSALLATFLPTLRQQLKRLQVKQTVSSQVGATLEMTNLLLETPNLLHGVEKPNEDAIADFLNLETRGVSVQYFFADDVVGIPNQKNIAVAQINYLAGTALPLPHNTVTPNALISGIWECYLEVPDNGFYNFYIETDASAEVQLSLERKELDKPDEPIKVEVEITLQNGIWQNREAIALKAGQLYSLKLILKKVKDKLILKWESKGLAKESIPTNYLYPSILVERFTVSYLRLLKTFAIAEALNLSPTEVNYFGTYSDYHINGKGWLNVLPISLLAENAPILPELTKSFIALLHYKGLKEGLKVQDDTLIKIFINPKAITEEKTTKAPKTILEQVTGWNNISLEQFYNWFKASSNPPFNSSVNELKHLNFFLRIKEAFALAKKLEIKASTLLTDTTNEPTAEIILHLQSALRARYDESSWIKVIQPINDKLRNLQRDALVTFILHQFQQKTETEHINTPNKLFEYSNPKSVVEQQHT